MSPHVSNPKSIVLFGFIFLSISFFSDIKNKETESTPFIVSIIEIKSDFGILSFLFNDKNQSEILETISLLIACKEYPS
jgi:hypothetical protein